MAKKNNSRPAKRTMPKKATNPANEKQSSESEGTDSAHREEKQEPVTTPARQEGEVSAVDLLNASGFGEPVIQRQYSQSADMAPSHSGSQPAPQPVGQPILRPNPVFPKSRPIVTVGAEYSSQPPIPEPEPQGPPEMQFEQLPVDTGDGADSLNEQVGGEIGRNVSDIAFGYLENFYPEIVAYLTEIDEKFIEKAKLPLELEADIIRTIRKINASHKSGLRIGEFHKKNILPPLKRILTKKGWEDAMSDEVQLVIALCVLVADSFLKIRTISKENKLHVKEIQQKLNEHMGVVGEQDHKIDVLNRKLADMQAQMAAQTPTA